MVWTYPALRSHVVMSVYSAQQYEQSVMKDCCIRVAIPHTTGWYRHMLVFNADGFAGWSGINARMTVLYSFGAFDLISRASSLYDTKSGKYSAFYGAYVVEKDGGAFGFKEDGSPDAGEVTAAVRYDYTQLVLANFGCKAAVFEIKDMETAANAVCAGSGGWTRIDAALRVSGVLHAYSEDSLAYLQYGRPARQAGKDFAETDMTGRVYAKHFPSSGCTVMLYCIAPERETVDECDAAALQRSAVFENDNM
jgi:hypothetical protein